MDAFLRFVARPVAGRPLWVVAAAVLITLLLYANIGNLSLETDLTALFGERSSQGRAFKEFTQQLGYGRQLFVVVETAGEPEATSERMEGFAERLIADMKASGRFHSARSGLSEEEILGIARLYASNFPYFVPDAKWPEVRERLSDAGIRAAIRRASAGLVTPFSTLGASYFLADPLGLVEFAAGGREGFAGFTNFDFDWGGGNRFFSRDHRALLVIAEPREPAMNYHWAVDLVRWTRARSEALLAEEEFRGAPLKSTLAGAYVYTEQDRGFIERNIGLVSAVSIIGNLLLCLVTYRRIPLLIMSLLPTGLGIVWTTGFISYYPGAINLLSLSFVAILAGLGDDQIVHFFNRVPQEWRGTGALDDAMLRTFATTGKSVLFCITTMATATVALAVSSFKGLAEFGFVLTVGLVMLLAHTLFTVPALVALWWKFARPPAPESVQFRFLPALARVAIGWAGRWPRLTLALFAAVTALSIASLPALRVSRRVEITRGQDSAAIRGQTLLAAKFGVEGVPELILAEGSEQEVLRRSEQLAGALEALKGRGMVKSVFSPTEFVPSRQTQEERARRLAGLDLTRAAASLRSALRENGFRLESFEPAIARLAAAGSKALTLEQAEKLLPHGLLDNSIRRRGPDRYLAAIAYYGVDPDEPEPVPGSVMRDLERRYGPFTEFSYGKLNRDLQAQIAGDSRRALMLTAAGVVLIVWLCFRSLTMTALVLSPIAFALVASIGLLAAAGHQFSFMALTALPLILGIGIDNGIHLVRRYLESDERDIIAVTRASGAALIQSNLTTIVGFGALMVATFAPLAEMGLVTAVGVALALAGALWLIPALILVFRAVNLAVLWRERWKS